MTSRSLVSSTEIRHWFSRAMSAIYLQEVPAYGTLMEIVSEVNAAVLIANPHVRISLDSNQTLNRISEERHGAIRLGTEAELSMMRRVFGIMGMYPVGYYDLSVAGIPVHSTAFRPIDQMALNESPFRIFTSLLMLDLLSDPDLKREASTVLKSRKIFSSEVVRLVEVAEREGGLHKLDAELFVRELLETFRWHDRSTISNELYQKLHKTHRLIADVVSFKGSHINHLAPRTFDIDRVQELMPVRGIKPKKTIEGPPSRKCPVLLRQTSFIALEEPISFQTPEGSWIAGTHTARFGEIEQRGAALTPKGRALYDKLLALTSDYVMKGKIDRTTAVHKAFLAFPDSYAAMREEGLAYFEYTLTEKGKSAVEDAGVLGELEDLVLAGFVSYHPIVYEDFLPASAAGIFQSNLGADAAQPFTGRSNKLAFEQALGVAVLDEFELYSKIEHGSIERCLKALTWSRVA